MQLIATKDLRMYVSHGGMRWSLEIFALLCESKFTEGFDTPEAQNIYDRIQAYQRGEPVRTDNNMQIQRKYYDND